MLEKLKGMQEVCWRNPGQRPFADAIEGSALTMADVRDAEARLQRFAAYFQVAFPETRAAGGILESPLRPIPAMQEALGVGRLLLKMDSHLPMSGSIKARGGVDEVIKLAEDIDLVSFVDYDSNFYELYSSRMDCIVQPVEELGAAAGEQILSRVENPEAPVFEKVLTSAYRPYDTPGAWSTK